MSLISCKDLLEEADHRNTAIISFMCVDYNMVYSVVHSAEKTGKPAIVMILPEYMPKNNMADLPGFVKMANDLADSVKVPIAVHLDHSYTQEEILLGIKAGFTSVMIDGSAMPLEDNIALTRTVCDIAHTLGVAVEAELGHVGSANAREGENKDLYTKPDLAGKFVDETKCDYLTISIGNAHGVYIETPHLDIRRLDEINAATSVPLVLHGGSGIPEDQLKVAFTRGINKFNVGTEFLQCYYDSIVDYTREMESSDNAWKILDLPKYAQERMSAYLEKKLQLTRF
ncbi:MAG: class II fructose-bisphosphate aldolase [Lachnospiraceae bacterium]|jgi:fructose-bisphosphate aldolase class II|nr:class II fructose-bisphosphate aldolase [Lachnospiraceae bacterium]